MKFAVMKFALGENSLYFQKLRHSDKAAKFENKYYSLSNVKTSGRFQIVLPSQKTSTLFFNIRTEALSSLFKPFLQQAITKILNRINKAFEDFEVCMNTYLSINYKIGISKSNWELKLRFQVDSNAHIPLMLQHSPFEFVFK